MISPNGKLKTVEELELFFSPERRKGRVVLCHGVFDVLHPGHIAHLQAAKALGDFLVVGVTSDRYVNKGHGHPVYPQNARLAQMAALAVTDVVVLSDYATGSELIEALHPDVFVKGKDYRTQHIPEMDVAERLGIKFVTTDTEKESAFKRIEQRLLSGYPEETLQWLESFRTRHSLAEIEESLSNLAEIPLLIVGEQITDVYSFVSPLAKSPRENHMAFRAMHSEVYEGGAKAILNHLRPWISHESCLVAQNIPIMKQRFVDVESGTKLFGIQDIPDEVLNEEERHRLPEHLKGLHTQATLALDYGHGFFDDSMRHALSSKVGFLGVNAQTNSANYGRNLITKWGRADYVAMDMPEYQLAENAGWEKEGVGRVLLTDGKRGCRIDDDIWVPALAQKVVDRVGAGDALFAFSAAMLIARADPEVAAFVGSCAAGLQCAVFGNHHPVFPNELWGMIESLM